MINRNCFQIGLYTYIHQLNMWVLTLRAEWINFLPGRNAPGAASLSSDETQCCIPLAADRVGDPVEIRACA